MENRDWNRILDRYLTEHEMSVDDYLALDDTQKIIIQEIKKSIKRLHYGR